MKIITVPQPWASAALFNLVEVLNSRVAMKQRGRLLIHAHGRDATVRQRDAPELYSPLASVQGAILGFVEVVGCSPADQVQIPYARGPVVIVFHTPRLFLEPLPWPRIRGVGQVHTSSPAHAELAEAVQQAVEPREWLHHHAPDPAPEAVHPRRSDGWVGD